jgi:hypothetical protein
VSIEEFKKDDFTLLHHKFFYKGEWGWCCRVIASLIPFMSLVIFFSSYYLVDPLWYPFRTVIGVLFNPNERIFELC